MIITDIRYYPYRVPFKHPFTTAHGTLTAREGVIVELVTDAGVSGYGDMAAVTEFGAPDVPTLLRAAREAEPAFCGPHFSTSRGELANIIYPGPSALAFALERAIFDAVARTATTQPKQRWLLQQYGGNAVPPKRPVPVNATVSAPSIPEATKAVQNAIEANYGCIKLKVGMLTSAAAEIARVRAISQILNPTIHLRLDANEAWSRDEAEFILHELVDCNLQYVEQPLVREDLEGMRLLRERTGISIAADESLSDLASLHRLLDADATDIFIIKPQMVGNLSRIMDIHAYAMQFKKQMVLTTSLESGIGVAATHAIAQMYPQMGNNQPVLLECGLATLPLLEDDLIIERLPIRGGYMFGASTPMQRVTPDWDALARYCLEVDGL